MSFLIQHDQAPLQLPPHPYTFPLDPFQQHAICAIAKDENVLVCAKTGSGKTLVGEYQIFHSLSKGKRVFYTTPIKSLSNQKFHDLKHQFKETTVGIMTGDTKFCPDARIVIMTTEILRNLLYKKGTATEHLGLTACLSMDEVDAVIFDECHYMNDKDRGKVWEETMILLDRSINMVMLSATLDRPEDVGHWLGELKQKPIHLIQTHYRVVPLTHYLLGKDDKLLELMDAKDVYHERTYKDWYQWKKEKEDEKDAFRRLTKEERSKGTDTKKGFVYHLNHTLALLEKKELLPAIFFILSRKKCEAYASQIEATFLTSSEIAAVKHIISFHLHRNKSELEKLPQYYKVYDLLCRGIAFHHSGIIPLLKEIVELLFAKGFVKIMFCTETFAVGLNMPTKTVLFAGFKKYDETMDSMRMLRTDEYLQMAGRAGRRGKDDKGVVIYLPDTTPSEPIEMFQMMKGQYPPITSRMDFHYDFILKIIQASDKPLKWLEIMEQSYWFQQQQQQIQKLQKELYLIEHTMETMTKEEPYWEGTRQRLELEKRMVEVDMSSRKKLQSEISTLKNRQLGPKWKKATEDFTRWTALQKQSLSIQEEIAILADHRNYIQPYIDFLHRVGYLAHSDMELLTKESLTLKGILATEVNEGHPILMTELYVRGQLHHLSGDEIVYLLSCFHDRKSSTRLLEPKELLHIREEYQKIEDSMGYPVEGYWNISTEMMEPMREWLEGADISSICGTYDIFEGNFMRAVMKLSNMMDELLTMATYCQHVEQIEKIMEVRGRLVRDGINSDSLYLRM
jgi:superfamily II RNA helicase